MELVKDKRIGKILFIVEGGKHEFTLVKKIFGDILGYKRIEKRRTRATYYVSKTDNHSVVAVINTKTSNIESINEKKYLDLIYTELIMELIKTLKNSRENEDNMMGGMLILSYPSIESYEVSNFVKGSYNLNARLGADVKAFIVENAKDISINKISEETIIYACDELIRYMKENGIAFDIDEYSVINMNTFSEEESYFKKNNSYFLLSMMSCILMDLGILRETREE